MVAGQTLAPSGQTLTIKGNYSGSGTVYTAVDLNFGKTQVRPNGIDVNGAVTGSPLINITFLDNGAGPNNVFFGGDGRQVVAKFNSVTGFAPDTATNLKLKSYNDNPLSFFNYSYQTVQDPTNAARSDQDIVQTPKPGLAAGTLTQVATTVIALNSSFFQNTAAFLGQPQNPKSNEFHLGVWNRDGESLTGIESVSSVQGLSQSSKVVSNLFGTQFGFDGGLFNIQNSGYNVHFGVTGGEVFASSTELNQPGTNSRTRVPFGGVYAALTGHGFAGMFQVRYDDYHLTLNSAPEQVFNHELRGHGLTYSGDFQYIIPITGNYFIEPSAGAYITRANVGDLVFGAGRTSIGGIDSALGRIGMRGGFTVQNGPLVFQPYASLNLFHEFDGPVSTEFTAGNAAFTILSSRVGTFGQGGVGIGVQAPGIGLTGYVRTDARFGQNIQGWTLTSGLRYSF